MRRPDLEAFGMGGTGLSRQGCDCVVSSEDLSVMGFSEVLGKLPEVFRALVRLRRETSRRRPDAAILIDFPDFHAVLSRRLLRAKVPLIYYVPPAVWAWRPGRAKVIAARARRILAIYSFELEIYRPLGADVVWVGHPIVDDVREGLAVSSRRSAREDAGAARPPAGQPALRGAAPLAAPARRGRAAGAATRLRGLRRPSARPDRQPLSRSRGGGRDDSLGRHPPAARVGGSRARRLGHRDARGCSVRGADDRRL